MQPNLDPSQRRRQLVVYFMLAYALSWAIEIPIALSAREIIAVQVSPKLHYLAAFGPCVAALIVVGATEGWPGLRRLLAGLTRWRVGRGYALFAILVPPALFALAVVVSRFTQGGWPDLGLLGEADYLPRLGVLPVLGLWLLTFGLGEELGWRGFALPRLQASRSAYAAALVLGVVWAMWHIPAFFYRDTYMEMGLLVVPMVVFSVTVASVVMTWLYNGTQGSLLMVVLFHALFDFFSVSQAGGDGAPIVMSAVVVFWAVRAVKVYGPADLAPAEKVVV
jgi:membrane protease YdiL (CAAX protease family)